jgi:hypothetical protein
VTGGSKVDTRFTETDPLQRIERRTDGRLVVTDEGLGPPGRRATFRRARSRTDGRVWGSPVWGASGRSPAPSRSPRGRRSPKRTSPHPCCVLHARTRLARVRHGRDDSRGGKTRSKSRLRWRSPLPSTALGRLRTLAHEDLRSSRTSTSPRRRTGPSLTLAPSFPARPGPCHPTSRSGASLGVVQRSPLHRRTPWSQLPASPSSSLPFGASPPARPSGRELPAPVLVPPSGFRTPSAACSSMAARACFVPLPILGFTAFPLVARRGSPRCAPALRSLAPRRKRRTGPALAVSLRGCAVTAAPFGTTFTGHLAPSPFLSGPLDRRSPVAPRLPPGPRGFPPPSGPFRSPSCSEGSRPMLPWACPIPDPATVDPPPCPDGKGATHPPRDLRPPPSRGADDGTRRGVHGTLG